MENLLPWRDKETVLLLSDERWQIKFLCVLHCESVNLIVRVCDCRTKVLYHLVYH